MLAYVLAIAVALGSLSLYIAAFLLPEVHRKYDLIWSGVGLFYGLVLWICAGRITGGVLLGQIASVSLIGWFGWQTLKLRLAETSGSANLEPGDSRQIRSQVSNGVPPLVQSAASSAEISLTSTVRARMVQYRQQLRQNPETSSVLLNLDRLVDEGISAIDRLRIWFSALMSTTITDAEQSSQPPRSPSPQPPQPPQTSFPSAPQSPPPSPSSPVFPDTVRIEVESFSTDSAELETPELAAEWSDLEFDTDPEMETIDDSIESMPDDLKRSSRRPNSSTNSQP